MAKRSKPAGGENKLMRDFSESDTWNYYDVLNYGIAPEDKDEMWAAKAIAFIKGNSQPFQDPAAARLIRERVAGELDVAYHKKRIDPDKGEAEYFSADWKACPIDQHLDEIIETNVKQIPLNLGVKAVDEFSISNQQKNNRKILKRALAQNIINDFNQQLGFPLLKKTDDPFRYIEDMQAALQQDQEGAAPGQPAPAPSPQDTGSGTGRRKMMPADVLNSLIAEIDNDELLGIYNQFLHKEGIEIACELGIDYYLNFKNKFTFNYASDLLRDIKAFGKGCIRMYTSQTTGTPVIQYFRPENIYMSDYSKRDVSDHIHWYFEEDVTFSDFTRMFGAKLKKEELEKVFELNRQNNGLKSYSECSQLIRNNAKIRIAYAEWESQDVEVFADYRFRGNAGFKKMPSDFEPGFKKDKDGNKVKDNNIEDSKREERHYNVWYKCYFIPQVYSSPTTASLNFAEQAKYIFDFGKLQDQERYGDDERFSRSSLIAVYSDRMTWYEIKSRFMDQINHLWLQFQNDLSNVMPAGLNWAYDLIAQMTSTVDDANKNGKDSVAEWAAKVKQTGTAITKLLRNNAGDVIGNGQPFSEIKTGFLEGALEKLNAMMVLYTLMVKALGQNELSEGGAPKPRTNLGSIEIALGNSSKAAFYVEELYTDIITGVGTKMIKYFKDIVDEGGERMKEFEDIVGAAHATALKEIKGIKMRNLGLMVENQMTKDQKDMLIGIAQSMASAGTLDIATALFLTMVDNLKQAYAILAFKKDKMERKLQEQKQQEQQFQMQLVEKQLEVENAKLKFEYDLKTQLEAMMISLEGKIEEKLVDKKGQWTVTGKEKINENRIEQDITKSQLERINNPQPEKVPAAGA